MGGFIQSDQHLVRMEFACSAGKPDAAYVQRRFGLKSHEMHKDVVRLGMEGGRSAVCFVQESAARRIARSRHAGKVLGFYQYGQSTNL